MSRILIAYYSRRGLNHTPQGIRFLEKGNTEFAAEHIAKATGGCLFRIDTVRPYAGDYRECCMEAVAEAKAKARPELKEYLPDLSGYDKVFVCYPCWCGTAPMSVFTFLEHYDLTGKEVYPLCTHEGSGLANSESDIAAACPGAAVKPGLAVRGHLCESSYEEIANWALGN